MAASNPFKPAKDMAQKEALGRLIDQFSAWRQSIVNGLMPIGIGGVGKSSFLRTFDSGCRNLFFEFNRTPDIEVNNRKLRPEFHEACNARAYKEIDTPGDFPEAWSVAYFDELPKVLLVMVDERPTQVHIEALYTFLRKIQEGPTTWQWIKRSITFRNNNLQSIIFVFNKIDKLDSIEIADSKITEYKSIMADLFSELHATISFFKCSVTNRSGEFEQLTRAIVESMSR